MRSSRDESSYGLRAAEPVHDHSDDPHLHPRTSVGAGLEHVSDALATQFSGRRTDGSTVANQLEVEHAGSLEHPVNEVEP